MKTNTFKSIPVEEYSTPVDKWVQADTRLKDVWELMNKEGYRHVPVVENNKPIGIFSDRDLKLLSKYEHFHQTPARELMTEHPYCVTKNTPIDEVAMELSSRKIGSAIVVNENGEIDSIFTVTDALNALIEVLRGENSAR
jgi:acetoin utilization protein AcuB